ncbi:MAG: AEC family transporter [Lachnospiraceae bacterium]|nr:AEC family transporter [Lachnospiraceae bacterium]
MISLLLAQKIAQLFLIILLGYIMVKWGLFQPQDSYVLSKLSLYLLMPMVIFDSFQMEYSPVVSSGLLLAFAASTVAHILMILLATAGGRLWHLSVPEQCSLIYTNAGSLIIPIVSSVLGTKWVIYTSAYLTVQNLFVWTHGICLFSGMKKIAWKKILCNPNLFAILLGLLTFFGRVRLPGVILDTVSTLGSVIGPICMLVTGMLFAALDLKKLLQQKRLYFIIFLRMLFCPALILLVIICSGTRTLSPDSSYVMLVVFLAVTTPSASLVTQLAQLHRQEPEYVSAINIATTLVSIATMPLFVALYETL